MYEAILERFQSLRPVPRKADTWVALCPAHEDRNPSVSVAIRNGRLLVYCFAGCSTNAIARALGVPVKAWFPEREKVKRMQRRIIETYDYADENGEVLYQAVRYEPKGFSQRRPDGKGGWIWSLYEADGKTLAVRRVLYRLPELVADKRRMVLIPEGERHVNALAKMGFLATCNVGGAGKWCPDYSRALAGRHICLLPDNDDPGIAHAAMVAGSLMVFGAASLRTLNLPGLGPKGDILDWLKAGGTKEALKVLIRGAEAWRHGKAG